MKQFISIFIIAALALGLTVQAKAAQPQGKLKGTITLSGAFALYPMVVKWAEEFRKIHPDVKIDVTAGGAGKGIADALSGAADIGMVSREIHETEVQKGAWWVAVTKDAVVPIVNARNPLLKTLLSKGVSRPAFEKIYISEEITEWNAAMGGSGGPAIHVYTRSDSCGAAEIWAKFLGKKQEDLAGVGVYGDPGLTEAVRKDDLGIGYNNINYAYDAASKKAQVGVAVLPIDLNGNGRIDNEENFYGTRDAIVKAIAEGRYPSPPARDLYFVCKGVPQNQLVKAFIRWVLTEGQKYVGEAGYIKLADQKLKEGAQKLK